jgi:hypothetical protein
MRQASRPTGARGRIAATSAPWLRTVLLAIVTWFVLLLALGLGGALEKWQIAAVTVVVFGPLVARRVAQLVRGWRAAVRAHHER